MTSEKDLCLQALMAKCWKQANLCSSLCYEGEKEFNIPCRFTAFAGCKSRGNYEATPVLFVACDVMHPLQY